MGAEDLTKFSSATPLIVGFYQARERHGLFLVRHGQGTLRLPCVRPNPQSATNESGYDHMTRQTLGTEVPAAFKTTLIGNVHGYFAEHVSVHQADDMPDTTFVSLPSPVTAESAVRLLWFLPSEECRLVQASMAPISGHHRVT